MMAFRQVTVTYPTQNGYVQVISKVGDQGAVYLYNNDASQTIYLTDNPAGNPASVDAIPLGPLTGVSLDGNSDVFAFMLTPGTSAILSLIPGGGSFFQPASLSAIGGASVFIQASTPTGTIPNGSIWLKTSGGTVIAFSTWNGSSWVQQSFNATDLLTAGTIIANLVAAGTVIAGIVDSTTITAATFKGNAWQEDSNGAVFYDPLSGDLFASTASRLFVDSFGNNITYGHAAYNYAAGKAIALNDGVLEYLYLIGGAWTNVAGISADSTGRITINNNTVITGTITPQAELTNGFAIDSATPPPVTATQCATYTDANATAMEYRTGSGLVAYVPAVQVDTGTRTLGNSTTAVAITRTWNIPANDAFVSGTLGTIYEIIANYTGTVELATVIQFGIILDGVFFDIAPVTPGFTASHGIVGGLRLTLGITATGAGGSVSYFMDGTMQDSVSRTPATSMTICGFPGAVTFDTTATHNFAIGAKFSATVTGETLSGIGSRYSRYGQ
jgi:hypothetical protein